MFLQSKTRALARKELPSLSKAYCTLTPKLEPLLSVASEVNGESLVGSFSESTVTKMLQKYVRLGPLHSPVT